MRRIRERATLSRLAALEWRNWQTRRTQNPVGLTPRVGSTPTSSTIFNQLQSPGFAELLARGWVVPKFCPLVGLSEA